MKVFYEFGLRQVNKRGEELCGDSVEFTLKPDAATLVLSDGLGSGVKASILSTLTTRIATRMLDAGLPLDEVVRTVSETLPICRVRKIAYSTFSIGQLSTEGSAEFVVFDNPPPLLVRGNKAQRLDAEEHEMGGKRVSHYSFPFHPGDWLVLVSDGVLNAGIGGAYRLGWGWESLQAYVESHVHESLSAEGLASKLARVVEELYEGPPGDDVSIAVVKARRKRTLTMLIGPPAEPQNDDRVVDALMSGPGRRVVCGGTTARIVARRLGRPIEVDLETGTESVPPIGRIEGIDLVTEGTLTVTKALEILREELPGEPWKLKIDGANRLVDLLSDADAVKVIVGRAMNPAHQNPKLPKNLSLKTQVIEVLAEVLRRKGKQVDIEYY